MSGAECLCNILEWCREMKKVGNHYFRNMWHLLELLLYTCACTLLSIHNNADQWWGMYLLSMAAKIVEYDWPAAKKCKIYLMLINTTKYTCFVLNTQKQQKLCEKHSDADHVKWSRRPQIPTSAVDSVFLFFPNIASKVWSGSCNICI